MLRSLAARPLRSNCRQAQESLPRQGAALLWLLGLVVIVGLGWWWWTRAAPVPDSVAARPSTATDAQLQEPADPLVAAVSAGRGLATEGAAAGPAERAALQAPADSAQDPTGEDVEADPQTWVEVLCRYADRDAPAADVEVFPLSLSPELVVELEAALSSGTGLEQLLRSRVAPERTDAVGRAQVRLNSGADAFVAALAPGYSGFADPGPVTGEVRIELLRDQNPEVLVLDSNGAPVQGAVVSLCLPLGAERMDLVSCSTDSAGRGTISIAGQILKMEQGQGLLLRVKGLFEEPQEQPLDLEAELTRFQLPPFGWIELTCEPPAIPGEKLLVGLSRLGESVEAQGDGLEALLGPEAHLRLGPVALGQQFEARGSVVGSELPWLASGPGPEKPGESVALRLRRAAALQVQGLALGPDGQPLERVRIAAELLRLGEAQADSAQTVREQLRSDGEGRFTWDLPSETEGKSSARLSVSRRGVDFTAVFDLPKGASGTLDVGAIRFEEVPPLASGRILDPAGQAISGAACALIQAEPLGSGMSMDREIRSVRSDKQGRFTLRAPWVTGPFQLSLAAKGYATRELLVQQPGELGDITLQRAARLRGRVLLGPDAAPQGFQVLSYARANEQFQTPLDGEGRFALEDLATGTYQLFLRGGGLLGGDLNLWSAVEFSAEAGDLDLGTTDLSGRLLRTELHVVDPQGQLIPSIALATADVGTEFFNNWNSLELAQGQAGFVLWHSSDIQRAQVLATGYRSAYVEIAGGRIDLTLTPSLVAVLHINNFAAIPETVQLYARIESPDPERPNTVNPLTEANSKVFLELPGLYTFSFHVLPKNQYWSPPNGAAPSQQFELRDLPELQGFEFALPAELLEQARQLADGE